MSFLTPAKVTLAMLGVVGLLIGGYFAKTMLAREEVVPQEATRAIPMAITDIPAGTFITDAHIGEANVDQARLSEYPDIALRRTVVVNRVAKEPIKAATPIRTTQLYPPGEFPSLEVQPGMRAVSLSVGDSTNLVSGLIKPGQYVDVHLTPASLPDDERTGGGLTMTLFKGVKVLAVNRSQRIGGAVDRSGNQVTLELTPRQSNVVILAQERGELTLSYNPEGKGEVPPAPGTDERATFNEILGLPPVPPPTPPFITEHYRGSGRSTLPFRDGKYLDIYAATTARPGYGGGSGYPYGAGGFGYGNYGNQHFSNPAPPIWFQSHQRGGDATGDAPAQRGNGPAPSGLPRTHPSAQLPPAPRT